MATPANNVPDKLTPVGILSFPNLFVPRATVEGAVPRYSVNIIFDKTAQATPEFKQLKSEIVAVARAKWPGKADEMLKAGQLRLPIRKASEKAQWSGYDDPDAVFINAWSLQKPDVLDRDARTSMMASDVFAGCTGRITYNCFAYDQSGNKGIGIGLNHVQIRDKDENARLDNRKTGRASFDALDGVDSNGSSGDEDEIPFFISPNQGLSRS